MSDVAIRVEGLGKQYRLGQREPYKTVREAIRKLAAASVRLLSPSRSSDAGSDEYIWALKDASFEVERGEVLGIIGPNGSGKSTLLKMLSRITEPTAGRAEVHGRVGSLLEVGTGFHPELTGRENVYLNGAILGMRRGEIDQKLDEIIDFAGIERFVDTPVKRYSSGMYVRLAFAVAAHLETEILLVDEVLAVGDAAFQKKCMEQMSEISTEEGRTILFVSHNLEAVASLCSKGLVLAQGHPTHHENINEAVAAYVAGIASKENPVDLTKARGRGDKMGARLVSVSLCDASGTLRTQYQMWDELNVDLAVEISAPHLSWQLHLAVLDKSQRVVSVLNNVWSGADTGFRKGVNRWRVTVPHLGLFPGTYGLTPMVRQEGLFSTHKVDGAITFDVSEPQRDGVFLNVSKHSTGSQIWMDQAWSRLEDGN